MSLECLTADFSMSLRRKLRNIDIVLSLRFSFIGTVVRLLCPDCGIGTVIRLFCPDCRTGTVVRLLCPDCGIGTVVRLLCPDCGIDTVVRLVWDTIGHIWTYGSEIGIPFSDGYLHFWPLIG